MSFVESKMPAELVTPGALCRLPSLSGRSKSSEDILGSYMSIPDQGMPFVSSCLKHNRKETLTQDRNRKSFLILILDFSLPNLLNGLSLGNAPPTPQALRKRAWKIEETNPAQ